MSSTIEIVEVSPRDGLQNEHQPFSTRQKIELITRLAEAGAKRIEVASFVRSDRVPQMADAEEVVAGLSLPEDVITIGLVLNRHGLHRALETSVSEIGAVCVASDAMGERNQGQTADESCGIAVDILKTAKKDGRRAQVTIASAFGCPFEGEIPLERVIRMASRLAEAEPFEIALADTIGVAVPSHVAELVSLVKNMIPSIRVRGHFHNTRNTGIANAWAAVEAGASSLDASLAGIGGCPFAPAATGNIATEDLLYLLQRSGVRTGCDMTKMLEAAAWLSDQMGRRLPGMVSRAGPFPTGTH